jgi:hypothetical protein
VYPTKHDTDTSDHNDPRWRILEPSVHDTADILKEYRKMAVEWTAVQADWVDDDSPGMVNVTSLHWQALLVEGEYTARAYGAAPDTGNRVYTKAALEAVPANIVVNWIHDALGADEVAALEQRLADDISQQQNPTSGSTTPK